MRKNVLTALILVGMVIPFCSQSASAMTFGGMLKSTTGVIFGFPVGTVIGGLRGITVGTIKGTQAAAEAIGNKNGIIQNVVGFPVGGPLGLVYGGTSGIAMGAIDGLRYGWNEPWAKKSFSAGGDDLLDYDPFYDWNDHWNAYGK